MVSSWQRRRIYPAHKSTDADYADDIALPASTPAQDQTQLIRLEQASAGIGLHVNVDKKEYMCLIKEAISSH